MKLESSPIKTEKKLIKIVFVITALGTGGAEMMLYKFLTRIDRTRYAPTVISMIDGGVFVERIRQLDIPVHFLGMKQGIPDPVALYKLTKLLNQIKPDGIQGWMYHANLASQIGNFFARQKAPILWSIHHSVDSLKAEKLRVQAIIKLTAMLSSKVDQVIFSAQKGQAQHISLGYDAKNAIAISDNFDISKYKPAANPQFDLRESLNLPENAVLIASVARYHPMKDHANIVRAAAELIKERPEAHIILVGPNVDNNNPVLTEQIQRLGVENHVHLLGERQDIPVLMTSFDIFTSGSAYGESFPNVLGEAMSCQIPCVATDIGDSEAIVGDTGVVVQPKNPEALAQGWRQLIDLGKEARQQLGIKARERIETQFNLDGSNSFVKKYESVYESILGQN